MTKPYWTENLSDSPGRNGWAAAGRISRPAGRGNRDAPRDVARVREHRQGVDVGFGGPRQRRQHEQHRQGAVQPRPGAGRSARRLVMAECWNHVNRSSQEGCRLIRRPPSSFPPPIPCTVASSATMTILGHLPDPSSRVLETRRGAPEVKELINSADVGPALTPPHRRRARPASLRSPIGRPAAGPSAVSTKRSGLR